MAVAQMPAREDIIKIKKNTPAVRSKFLSKFIFASCVRYSDLAYHGLCAQEILWQFLTRNGLHPLTQPPIKIMELLWRPLLTPNQQKVGQRVSNIFAS